MRKKNEELLEFDKIKKELLACCLSGEGVRLIEKQAMVTELRGYTEMHDSVDTIRRISEQYRDFPSLSFPPTETILLEVSRPGNFLEGEQLYTVAVYIRSASELKLYLSGGLEEFYSEEAFSGMEDPSAPVKSLVEQLDPPVGIMKNIFSVLDADGNVKENHPELKAIRRKLGALRRDLLETSSRYMNESRDLWQTDVPSQKDGRIVLPLKASHRGKIRGIVHDVSARGSTLYLEPFDILEKNNEVAIQEHELRQVVVRILRDLTAGLREEIESVGSLGPIIAEIDAIQARSRLSRRYRGVRPELIESGIVLKKARHPLLGDSAVPVDIVLDASVRSLIISGPNAGGKTVTLKTIGLLSLMNQFGIQIPAAEGSALPLFKGVYADIGDDQSIEASLSTFSGHMKSIAEIVGAAEEGVLVLLDELGSGTDPAEGAVLAMAILEELVELKALTVSTSHHGLLKNFGYTRKGAMNASMDFDEKAHMPTYRVIAGVPGESHAFDIAARSGMPGKLLALAGRYREESAGEVGTMIRELENQTNRMRREQKLLEEREAKLREEIRKNDLKQLKVRQRENELRMDGYRSLDKFIEQTRRELENLVRELREGEISREKTKKVKDFIAEIERKSADERAVFEQERARLEELELARFTAPSRGPGKEIPLSGGMQVFVSSYRKEGTLVRKEKGDQWLVSLGPMKLTLSEKELAPIEQKKRKVSVSYDAAASGSSAFLTIDVRGMRLPEALDALSRQVDAALIQGLNQFSIIHGTGEGILQSGIHEYLNSHGSIAEFKFAHPDDGGAGKTEVRLR
jgi:DNA mismatch repair protein MutS2